VEKLFVEIGELRLLIAGVSMEYFVNKEVICAQILININNLSELPIK